MQNQKLLDCNGKTFSINFDLCSRRGQRKAPWAIWWRLHKCSMRPRLYGVPCCVKLCCLGGPEIWWENSKLPGEDIKDAQIPRNIMEWTGLWTKSSIFDAHLQRLQSWSPKRSRHWQTHSVWSKDLHLPSLKYLQWPHAAMAGYMDDDWLPPSEDEEEAVWALWVESTTILLSACFRVVCSLFNRLGDPYWPTLMVLVAGACSWLRASRLWRCELLDRGHEKGTYCSCLVHLHATFTSILRVKLHFACSFWYKFWHMTTNHLVFCFWNFGRL